MQGLIVRSVSMTYRTIYVVGIMKRTSEMCVTYLYPCAKSEKKKKSVSLFQCSNVLG